MEPEWGWIFGEPYNFFPKENNFVFFSCLYSLLSHCFPLLRGLNRNSWRGNAHPLLMTSKKEALRLFLLRTWVHTGSASSRLAIFCLKNDSIFHRAKGRLSTCKCSEPKSSKARGTYMTGGSEKRERSYNVIEDVLYISARIWSVVELRKCARHFIHDSQQNIDAW